MRVILTGTTGYVGAEALTALQTRSDIDFILEVDVTTITTSDQWGALIKSNNIDTIYYIESIENDNICVPTDIDINRYQQQDFLFVEFLQKRDINVEPELNVMYLSTDRVYYDDSFPNELHSLTIQTQVSDSQPVPFVREDRQYFYSYAATKAMSEIKIHAIYGVNLKIIRPFAITGPGRHYDCPVVELVRKAMNNEDIELFEDGSRGVAFTHVTDLGELIADDSMFNEEVAKSLTSGVINTCRVQNYLSVYQLALKIVNKTESSSVITLDSGLDKFSEIMSTPQIRNMVRIYEPSITIEMILDDIIYYLDPTNKFQPLVVSSTVVANQEVNIVGTVEPQSAMTIFFGNGERTNVDVDTTGVFDINYTFEYPVDVYPIEIRVTKDNVQYDTVVVSAP